MKQVFIPTPPGVPSIVQLDEKQAHHLFDVLRTQPKEVIRAVSADGVYLGRIGQKPELNLFSRESLEQRKVSITLCVALVKQDKFEWMLQKAAELGVSRIVPFTSRRTVVSIDPRKEEKKMARWNTILQEACRQSNRSDGVQLENVCTLRDLELYRSSVNVCAYEKQDASQHLCCELKDPFDSITAVIGPEGGFDLSEALQLEEWGYALCSLGSQILRAETAACYVLSAIDYQVELFEGSCNREDV